MAAPAKQRIIIVPGNGCDDIRRANWYYSAKEALNEAGCQAVAESMPDPLYAREHIWLKFIRENLKCDENTIVIGHSSGAAAAMRLIETDKVKGVVLVSAYYTDLGVDIEAKSGYFNRPWNWEKMRENAGFIMQYHSRDDHLVPVEEARHVAKNLQSEYVEYEDRNHFLTRQVPYIVSDVLKRIKVEEQVSSQL